MLTSIIKTLLIVSTMAAVTVTLTGCSGSSASIPDAVGDFKTIAVSDSTAYKTDHWPTGGENLATFSGENVSSKIGSTDQYLGRFKSQQNDTISQILGNDSSKISDIQYYQDPSGLEVGVFTIAGPAADRQKLCGSYPAGTESPNSARTIWRYKDESLCAVLKDSVTVASTIPETTGPSQNIKPASKSFLDAYSAVLTKSGNLAAAAAH